MSKLWQKKKNDKRSRIEFGDIHVTAHSIYPKASINTQTCYSLLYLIK